MDPNDEEIDRTRTRTRAVSPMAMSQIGIKYHTHFDVIIPY